MSFRDVDNVVDVEDKEVGREGDDYHGIGQFMKAKSASCAPDGLAIALAYVDWRRSWGLAVQKDNGR